MITVIISPLASTTNKDGTFTQTICSLALTCLTVGLTWRVAQQRLLNYSEARSFRIVFCGQTNDKKFELAN